MSLLKPFHIETLFGDYKVILERQFIWGNGWNGYCWGCKFYNIGCDLLDSDYSEVRSYFCEIRNINQKYTYHPLEVSDICS